MLAELNPKILGSILIGGALVASAYTLSNFGEPISQLPANVIHSKAPARVAIPVTDTDENGVEDWRDALHITEIDIRDETSTTTYSIPETLTGRMSISLLENFVRSKNAGIFARADEQIVADTLSAYTDEVRDKLYGVKDIETIEQWNDGDIKNYANAMANIVLNVNVKPSQNELDIFYDIVTRENKARMPELLEIVNGYKSILEQSALVPVPNIFAKQHLDILNTYNAIYKDILAMTTVEQDPAVTLIRLKRYQEDAIGLNLAMQNMNNSLKPYAHLFAPSDSALFFNSFDADNQTP